ncbi:MAG: hypothetical protein U0X76_01595 [Bacteroidia bacterium]
MKTSKNHYKILCDWITSYWSSSITAEKDYFPTSMRIRISLRCVDTENLPSAEAAAIAHAVGNNLQIAGGLYAQY